MEREDLVKVGDPLFEGTTADGTLTKRFYYVAFDGKVVGVGLFHNDNADCTFAFITDSSGTKTILGHLSSGYTIDRFDMVQLGRLYAMLFK
ncbi:hypothetical protein BC792_105107 [Sphingobacterium allocomposti]|uniref:Uncharacterized protein n=1 Tax=Sphingobacterium allocomposti TaxID=415956 RepID=A0A5S5DNJ9_9SPHI|nr:hypothetical protein [Sphingobacterium composti Yoo et al. 2007 non Ten et al. 2007]TYP96616.1 hypothetical protein BC792_105107 [Sphingobacterium composti Yoo et al. 2007 non Ten et al. 2007]